MKNQTRRHIRRINKAQRRRHYVVAVFACVALALAMGVALALRRNGRAATHQEQVLSCPVTGTVAHHHDESCYDEQGNLACTLPEVEYHVHDDSCYEEETVLACGLEEGDEHTHTDACYQTERTLVCGKDEVTEAHQHGAGCFETVEVADSMPEQTFEQRFVDGDNKEVLNVFVDAPEGALPKGAAMKAEWVDTAKKKNADVHAAIQDAVAKKTDAEIAEVHAVDITFLDAEGNEVEPAKKVTVTFVSPQIASEDTNQLLVHVESDREAQERAERAGESTYQVEGEVIKPLTSKQLDKRDLPDEADELVFDADRSTVYAIAYTVDFRYDVDGKTYGYTLQGGDAVSVRDLLQGMGVFAATDADEFMAEVKEVTFSDASLVAVAHVDAAVTAGELRERLGLQARYSSEMTDEQAAEMDAKRFQPGDWALLSLLPFESEETLTVTMKNGDVLTIKVTDAQISTQYLSDSGDLYEVTVHYDDDAQIPEDATLVVTPYEEGSEEYSSVRDIVLEQSETDQIDQMRALDISIMGANGRVIEPKAPVRVDMVIKNLEEELETAGNSLTVLHLNASSGEVKVEDVADTDVLGNVHIGEEEADASFTLDSFSQFAITYGSYVRVNVHYVDVNGVELRGSTTTRNVYDNGTLTLSDYQSQMNEGGYAYLGAHYGAHSGQLITSLKATRTPTTGSLKDSGRSVTFYNGEEIVARQEYESSLRQVDVYLVYAPASGYYIQDTIGEDGCLAVYNGTEVVQTGTDQNLFVRWYRSDNATSGFQEVTQSKILNGNYNIPELDGPRVNVAIDEGADKYYKAEIYKVENNEEVKLAETAAYHVPYYDDVQNGSFETPHNNGTTDESVNRWPSNWQVENGQSGVVWKTTGTAADQSKRDIEIPQGANASGQGANSLGETLRNYCFAFMPDGNQCAELNCEASGALYQDILTIPGSQLYWSLYHRARGAYDTWKNKTDKTQNKETDTMYVVAMSKELAEKYDVTTQDKVLKVLNDTSGKFQDVEIVKITTTNQGNGTMTFMKSGVTLTVPPTYFGNLADGQTATAKDGNTNLKYGNTDWHYYTGNFSIPENQYLTRFFFVAGETASNNPTMGNFIDGIGMSDSVPQPNTGQATVIVQKTVTGLKTLPPKYATRIETTYKVTKSNGTSTPYDKNSDYDSYRTEIDASGTAVSTATWTFPINIGNGESIEFTKGEETAPKDTTKTDVVDGYTQSTSYVIRKQSAGQESPVVVAQGSGKTVPTDEISKLKVNEKDVIYIEFTNDYKPKQKVSVYKTDTAGNVIPTGASFALYKAGDFDDAAQAPKPNVQKVSSGTTGGNGILYLGELEVGKYRLVETKAPDGYLLLESPVHIIVDEGGVAAMHGTSQLVVTPSGEEGWINGQAEGTYQVSVWNNPGAVKWLSLFDTDLLLLPKVLA